MPIQDFKVNGQSTGYCQRYSCTSILDTGAGPLFVNGALAGHTIDVAANCQNFAQLPNVSVTVSGKEFVFTPKDYVYRLNGQCANQIVSSDTFSGKSQMELLTRPPTHPVTGESVMLQDGEMQFGK